MICGRKSILSKNFSTTEFNGKMVNGNPDDRSVDGS